MTPEQIAIVIVAGLLAGVLSGLVGIGGGIVLVPALVMALGFSQQKAQGTTLALFMFPVGLLAVLNYHRKGYVDWRAMALLGAGFILGAFLGSKLALSLPQLTIKRIFGALIIIIGIRMLFFNK